MKRDDLNSKSGSKSAEGSHIIAIRGHIYNVDPVFGIVSHAEGYGAIGSGAQWAIAALAIQEMYQERYEIEILPQDRLRDALEIASRFASGVGGRIDPFIKTWAISYKITQRDKISRLVTVIVIRKKPNGKLYFLSVMDK